jgi:hypothetical protein
MRNRIVVKFGKEATDGRGCANPRLFINTVEKIIKRNLSLSIF